MDLRELFTWPRASEVPEQTAAPMHKEDAFLRNVEQLVARRLAWAPITGTTRRAEDPAKLEVWLDDQARKANQVGGRRPTGRKWQRPDVTDFPEAANGKRTVTTSQNIVYLIDCATDLYRCYSDAFGDSPPLADLFSQELSVFLYVTNSVHSNGRAFSGDPFTGQIVAYSRIFGYDMDNNKERFVVGYYPHQFYTQLFTRGGSVLSSKGTRMLPDLMDLMIMTGGVAVIPATWELAE